MISKPEDGADSDIKLSFPRAYALSLSPQLIHAGSKLLSQLVSSRAFRQLEFLAVGSFFVYKTSSDSSSKPTLARIPSTREDVFSSTDLPARAKRQLMKFLKLVLSYQEEASLPQWQEYADRPLAEFLAEKMGLDAELRTYITTLTLSLNGQVGTKDGLATIHRHLTSMGMFGPGFAAVYPKWGGGSEIAQVACRAGAVGGGIYMLGTGIKEVKGDGSGEELMVELTDGTVIKTKSLVRGSEEVPAGSATNVSRLIAIIGSPLSPLFETTMEGAPTPGVAVVTLPSGSVNTGDGVESKYPIYAIAHSSETGECPSGQSILYLITIATPESKALLEASVTSLLAAIAAEDAPKPHVLYRLYYEQQCNSNIALAVGKRTLNFAPPLAALTFDDALLEPIYEAWKNVLGPDVPEETLADYMVFADREGVYDEDEYE